MASITLRHHGITVEAEEVGDHSCAEALEFAANLLSQEATFSRALVDRIDGLVLIGTDVNYHFAAPLCGYDGDGPRTTAIILELFGFAAGADIMSRINHVVAAEFSL